MTLDQITAAVSQIVIAQVEAIHLQTASLADLGLDELSAVVILMHVEKAFHIELSDDDVVLSSTINGIARVVSWHLKNKENHEALAPEIKKAWDDFPDDAA